MDDGEVGSIDADECEVAGFISCEQGGGVGFTGVAHVEVGAELGGLGEKESIGSDNDGGDGVGDRFSFVENDSEGRGPGH